MPYNEFKKIFLMYMNQEDLSLSEDKIKSYYERYLKESKEHQSEKQIQAYLLEEKFLKVLAA